jgi:hypothetical protein
MCCGDSYALCTRKARLHLYEVCKLVIPSELRLSDFIVVPSVTSAPAGSLPQQYQQLGSVFSARSQLIHLATELINNIIDPEPYTAQVRHDLLSSLISLGFGEGH